VVVAADWASPAMAARQLNVMLSPCVYPDHVPVCCHATCVQVAEGVATAGSVVSLARKYRVSLPVLTAVAQVRTLASCRVSMLKETGELLHHSMTQLVHCGPASLLARSCKAHSGTFAR
jgi:hypothetical protein